MSPARGGTVFLLFVFVATSIESALAAKQYHSPHVEENHIFDMTTVAAGRTSGTYSLLVHDVNADGRKDLISLAYSGTTTSKTQSPGEIYWYENIQNEGSSYNAPSWKEHLIVVEPHVVHGDWMDVDGDGRDDLVYNSHFEPIPEEGKGQGVLAWVKQPSSYPSKGGEAWQRHEIGLIVGNHRVVTGDFDGDGREKEVLAVPLFGVGDAPFFGASSAKLFYFDSGDRIDEHWKSFEVPIALKNMHDAEHISRAGGKTGTAILLASHEGISRLEFQRVDGVWSYEITRLADSTTNDKEEMEAYRDVGYRPLTDKTETPQDMKGITALSQVKRDAFKTSYIATIEYTSSSSFLDGQPWHGDIVALYTPAAGKTVLDGGLSRQVLERRYSGGHTTAVVDINDDDCQDVLAGFREYPTAFVLYKCHVDPESKEKSFHKQIISERGVNKIVPHDFNGDGKPDLATVGFGEAGDAYIHVWYNVGSSAEVARAFGIRDGGNDGRPSHFMELIPWVVLGSMVLFISVVVVINVVLAMQRRIKGSDTVDQSELYSALNARN